MRYKNKTPRYFSHYIQTLFSTGSRKGHTTSYIIHRVKSYVLCIVLINRNDSLMTCAIRVHSIIREYMIGI